MDLTNFQWVAAAIIGTLSVARTARLLIFDDLPPVAWLRARIVGRYKDESDWVKLWSCPFCMAPWLMAGMGVWFWLGHEHWTWWVINGWWAASYLAATYIVYDQPE
jgi:hypothetical protein